MRLGLVLLASVLAIVPAAGAGSGQFAKIAWVTDGDTVSLANGERVRLVQIDSPEIQERECYGRQARAELLRLTPAGSTVRLEADPKLDQVDRYGRLLRYLFRGPVNVNLELVRRGAATVWFYQGDRGRYAAEFLRAALEARAAKRGLWSACPRTPFDPYHAADTSP